MKYTRENPREYATDLCLFEDKVYLTGWADGHEEDNDAFLLEARESQISPILYFGAEYEVEGECILALRGNSGSDDPDGFVIGGAANHDRTGSEQVTANGHVFRIDMQGKVLWSRILGHEGANASVASYDYIHHMALDPKGNILVTGIYNGAYDKKFGSAYATLYVAKLNRSDGTLIWAKKIGRGNERSRPGGGVFGQGITATSDGGAIITGFFRQLKPNDRKAFDGFILKVDGQGGIEWQYAYPNVRTNMNTPIRRSVLRETGEFAAVGGNMRDPGRNDLLIVQGHMKDFSTGNAPKARIFGSWRSVNGYDIAVADEDHLLIAGFWGPTLDTETRKVFLGKIDKGLGFDWLYFYGGSRTNPRIAVSNEDRYYISGNTLRFQPSAEPYLIHADRDGKTGCENEFHVCLIDEIAPQVIDFISENDEREDELVLQRKRGKMVCEEICSKRTR